MRGFVLFLIVLAAVLSGVFFSDFALAQTVDETPDADMPDAEISFEDAPKSIFRPTPYLEFESELREFKADASTPDPLYSKQKALQEMNWLQALNILQDNITTQSPKKFKIGIIDHDQVAANHPDLQNIFDADSKTSTTSRNVSHGNFVTGIIAARTGNSLGISGAAGFSNVEIAYRTVNTETEIVRAIENLAANHVRVVNISLGINQHCKNPRINPTGSFETPLCQGPVTEAAKVLAAIRAAVSNNQMLFVISAGNSSEQKNAAALEPGVIIVGAMDERGQPSDYSNFGSAVTVFAPDYQIWGTTFDSYKSDLGTSFTTPLVTSAAALAMMYFDERNIKYTPVSIQSLLLKTARPRSGLTNKSYVAGSIDYLRLAQALLVTHENSSFRR